MSVRNFLRRTIYNRSYVLDLMVGLLLITTIYFLVGQRNQTENLNRIAEQNHELNVQANDILQQIKGCTDPTGSCYQQGSRRTNDAVGNISQIIVLANACTDESGVQTAAEVEKCVRSMLKGK
jgi:hypothetical protein